MDYDVIIIGGSFSGLSAALTLGRSMRKVLMLDSGQPCNRQTPHSHNLLTHDGEQPAAIASRARHEVLKYPTIQLMQKKVMTAAKKGEGFEVGLEGEEKFTSWKLLVATGLKDQLPDIPGLAECWGISAIHCPYCHGYEVRNEKIALLMNGEHAFDMIKNLYHWNRDIVLLTNGPSILEATQMDTLAGKSITVIEDEVAWMEHEEGQLQYIHFVNGDRLGIKAMYVRPMIRQHINFDEQLGFALTDLQTIQVDSMQQTSVPGVYAAGDCTTLMRTLSATIATGTLAAVAINKALIDEEF